MGSYLGKNTTGDLASILTGAYNSSSPAATTAPVNATQPLSPLNQTTTPATTGPVTTAGPSSCGVLKNGTKCFQCCRSKYAEGSQEFDRCFDACMGEDPGDVTQPCNDRNPCPTGKKCENGLCVDEGGGGTTTGCPEGSGKVYEGCACGDGYSTLTGKCPTGYVFIRRNDPNDWKPGIPYKEGAIGTCQCQKAIDDWKEKKGEQGSLGEFKYPPEMQALMDLLLARGKEFMGLTPGYSQEAQDKMFGRGFENVRGQEAGARTGMEQGLSRSGMLGTGAGQGMLNDLSWNTEGNVANLARDLFVGNEVKKKQDLLDYSTAAQSMLGSGMGFEQLLESINASRRGEGSAALQALLAWLMSQK